MSRVLAWIDAGLVPMRVRIMMWQENYIWTAVKKQQNPVIHKVLRVQLARPASPWTKHWMLTQKEIRILTSYTSKKQLNTVLTNMTIECVLKIKAEHTKMAVVPQPKGWFVLQDQRKDSMTSKTICCVWGGNVLLVKRFKNQYGCKYDCCCTVRWCVANG